MPSTEQGKRESSERPSKRRVEAHTRRWLRHFVIELALCPFAAAPLDEGSVEILVSDATAEPDLTRELDAALRHLSTADPREVETLLLVHPHCLADFEAYNQYLDTADERLEAAGLVGVVQIASFHPRYRFEGEAPDDPANFSNRSPYPMLHLLREASVERAVASLADPSDVPRRNVERLRALGSEAIRARLRQIAESAESTES